MKQKFKDIILLLKRDRKWQVIAVLCVVAVGYLMFAPQPTTRRLAVNGPRPQAAPSSMSTVKEHASDLAVSFKQDLEIIKSQNSQNQQEIGQLRRDLDENVQRSAEIFRKILERVAESENRTGAAMARASGRPGEVVGVPVNAVGGVAYPDDIAEADELQSFGDDTPQIAPPPPPPPGRVAIVGAGDSVRVKLLAGVNAPTDGSPYPVVFKLISDVYGPDGSTLPLGEARIIAAAQGSLADQRALFRMTNLSVRLPDGRRKELTIDGWVVGEDGIRGMAGVLIDPIGKGIAGMGFAGLLGGIGAGFAASNLETSTSNGNTTQIISGNTAEYAFGRGMAGMAREYSSVIRDRIDQLVPHVSVLSGREASAVFARSVTIPGLYEALNYDEDPFSSLD